MSNEELNENPPAQNLIGLATAHGRLEAKVANLERQLEQCRRDLTDYIRKVDQARVTTANDHAGMLREHRQRLTALEAEPDIDEDTVTDLPDRTPIGAILKRQPRESNASYYERLKVWAKETGRTAPPKPTPLSNAGGYDRIVQQWARTTRGTEAGQR